MGHMQELTINTDQWIGLDYERDTVLGWMSIDSALLMAIGVS